jgi:hypothetical protein
MDGILLIKTINQDSIGGAIFSDEFEFGIINDDVTVVFYAQLATYLQNNSRFVLARFPLACLLLARFHRSSRRLATIPRYTTIS